MANTYLQKTFGSVPTMTTFTVSFWIKRGKLGTSQCILESRQSGSTLSSIKFSASNRIAIYGEGTGVTKCDIMSSVRFKDTSGWYHVCIAVNTTLASANDRVKLYVNGVEDTDVTRNTAQVQNWEWYFSLNYPVNIGRDDNNSGSEFFDGSMSHFHYCTGTQYQASAFGSTDSTTGEWKINPSPSVSYGSNGYFILKDGNSVTDQSGSSNNFTVAGGNFTKTEDCPSNVFATWNSIGANLDTTLTNGNTKVAHGSQLERRPVISALGMSSGKYYAEFKALSGSAGNIEVGIVNRSDPTTQGRYMGQSLQDAGFIAYKFDGSIDFDGTNTSGLTTTATNDILGVAVDIDNTRVYFYKNGTLINSGGTSFANMQGGDGDYFFCNGDRSGSSTYSLEANFGNGYFGTTAVSSAGTNASGNGIFEHDVPAGFTALSTKGLNE